MLLLLLVCHQIILLDKLGDLLPELILLGFELNLDLGHLELQLLVLVLLVVELLLLLLQLVV